MERSDQRLAVDPPSRPEDWVKDLVAGDRTALSALYDAFARPVFNLACQILREQTVAEDLMQEVFLEAWRRAPSYSSERGSVAAWILCLTRSRALDRLRSEKARVRREQALGLRESAPPSPPDCASLSEQGQRLRGAFASLPTMRRRALELAYFEGMSQSMIAARLELPLGTVKTHIRLGLQSLRAAMKERP